MSSIGYPGGSDLSRSRMSEGYFINAGLGASQNNVPLICVVIAVGTGAQIKMPGSGRIVALSWMFDAAVSGGNVAFKVFKNNASFVLGSNISSGSSGDELVSGSFAKDDGLDMRYTTSVGFLGPTAMLGHFWFVLD